ncbi:hypothetical protein [Pedobacter nanyangensis]|uniref:hypothetical protein n=1 Tax=Pedobacter nanyangensis TaxID=1562389 RepID=UPI000DE3120E|nr:hypothetical protein [Pedobacter nanyangensis]
MEEEQFDEIISSLGMIETNTAWITITHNELEQVNQRLHNLEMVMLDNNKLLKRLVELLEKKNK